MLFRSGATINDFDMLSMEDLLNVTVTSATGREQKQMEVANAMTVITSEDIKRSGAKNLEDLFYRVPGMQVRRVTGSGYTIGIRDIASTTTNNLLVLIDGAVVFNPSFNATVWRSLPVTLGEIERIEIIRGPGGVLYSSNAVMGVVNIYTKSAKEAANYVSYRMGSQQYKQPSAALGTQPFKDIPFYIRTFYDFQGEQGFNKCGATGKVNDEFERHKYGFRAEYEFNENTKLLAAVKNCEMEATAYGLAASTTGINKLNYETSTVNVDFTHVANEHYDFNLKYHFTYMMLSGFYQDDSNVEHQSVNTQHNIYFNTFGKHVLSLGAELVFNFYDAIESSFNDAEQSNRVFSWFVQEEYRPFKNVIATAGVRVDDNTYVRGHKLLWQPRFSLMYLPSENHSVYITGSRMYRQPSTSERDFNKSLNGGAINMLGTSSIKAEEFRTYEAGYKGLYFEKKLNFNTNAYVSCVDDIIGMHNVFTGYPTTLTYINDNELKLYGFELDVNYKINNNWSVYADYSNANADSNPISSVSTLGEQRVQAIAKHIFGTGVRYTNKGLSIDMYGKYTDDITVIPYHYTASFIAPERVESFFTTFMRVAYEFNMPGLEEVQTEIEFVANNLFDARLQQTEDDYFIEPEIFGGLKFTF